MPGVRPELIKKLRYAHQEEDVERNSAEGHGYVENPVRERTRPWLAQCRGQVKLFALVVHRVGSPEQSYGMAEPVLPVIAEVVKYERENPGEPLCGRQLNR